MTEKRVFNFSAGPSTLPVPVLEKAAKQMLNYENSGISVMEMSHRSSSYLDIFQKTKERCIRDRGILMHLIYRVLDHLLNIRQLGLVHLCLRAKNNVT